jgi:hypothetical protein
MQTGSYVAHASHVVEVKAVLIKQSSCWLSGRYANALAGKKPTRNTRIQFWLHVIVQTNVTRAGLGVTCICTYPACIAIQGDGVIEEEQAISSDKSSLIRTLFKDPKDSGWASSKTLLKIPYHSSLCVSTGSMLPVTWEEHQQLKCRQQHRTKTWNSDHGIDYEARSEVDKASDIRVMYRYCSIFYTCQWYFWTLPSTNLYRNRLHNCHHSLVSLCYSLVALRPGLAAAPKYFNKTPVALLKTMCYLSDFGVLSRFVQTSGIALIRLVP